MAASILLGVIASLIAWWIVNIILIPEFDISELLYDNQSHPYVRVWNKSWLHIKAYEIICYIYYYKDSEKSPVFIRTDNPKPVLIKGNRKKNAYIVKLGGHEKLRDFFRDGNKLKIIVTGQNRFGVKQMYSKEIDIDDSNTRDVTYIGQHNDHYN